MTSDCNVRTLIAGNTNLLARRKYFSLTFSKIMQLRRDVHSISCEMQRPVVKSEMKPVFELSLHR
jgi:hypothetical protein